MRRTMQVALAMVLALVPLSVGCAKTAQVRLPGALGDHMVVQRGIEVPIWGWTDPGAEVTVRMGDAKAVTTADADGAFLAHLPPQEAGGPHTISVTSENTVWIKDVLVGDVWICSGQSNMQMAVGGVLDAKNEIADAKYPNIRLFTVARTPATEPKNDCRGEWKRCSPETVPGFSAVGYFFGRHLHKNLKVPIGLVNTSWGGTPSEAWTSPQMVGKVRAFDPIVKRFADQIAAYTEQKKKWDETKDERLAKWKEAAEKAKADGKKPPRKPGPPRDPILSPHRPSNLYNGMIAPLVPMRIRGAIWYQGESNASRAYQYRTIFPAMIQDWRRQWKQGTFPFLFVQLANFRKRADEPGDSAWAELREAQTMALGLPQTGMAVIIDIGDAGNIHPKNKQDVGKRLALAARAVAYGQDMTHSGPIYKSMKIENGTVRLAFNHVGGGLVAKGGGPLKGFAVAGKDKKWVWAQAKIDGETVVVSSDQVKAPVAVRYGWANNPDCNLYNKAGLPASPFRTDQWPGTTVNNQ
ncbi:MAG: sialate O-acetylesterase [Planctomycetota bacterium]|nr:sialate O-acetylesterase [Planctomycetota bacterium]